MSSFRHASKKLLIAAAVPAVFGAIYAFTLPGHPAAVAATQNSVAAPAAVQQLPNFTQIVEQNGPAVVNVSVTRRPQAGPQAQVPGMPEDDPLNQFFRRFGPPQPQGEPPVARGQGSGFIVSADGIILTNAHVAADATEITVKLTDKREFDARVLGVDKRTDIAVLKIEAKDLPTVRIGDAEHLKVGEWVAAIGSPFGFENTVTSGIVSAKARSLPDENYVPFIQTDVAVNPGNSGGPLFNLNGEVVGINSQIFSRTGGYMGLSFAIPIDVAMKIKDELVEHGKVTRGRIGVQIQEVNQALANSFGLPRPQGALISRVEPGSPAQKAGLKSGDVVLGVNGKEVGQLGQLSSEIAGMKPGSNARLDVWRNGSRTSIDVKVGQLDEPQNIAAAGDGAQGLTPKLGLTVRELAPEERAQLKTDGGLVVQNVSGAAARAGIQPGDVILALNDTPLKSVDQLRSLVQKAEKSRTVALLVQREDARLYVPLTMS
ncbi:MAG TPA: DegQ family serine endoprotease [Burkholderiales bacterium]|jgi:serine protease Do|nr:DegQ family serine endoprotease [Burkholderiales bacterium]